MAGDAPDGSDHESAPAVVDDHDRIELESRRPLGRAHLGRGVVEVALDLDVVTLEPVQRTLIASTAPEPAAAERWVKVNIERPRMIRSGGARLEDRTGAGKKPSRLDAVWQKTFEG